MTRNPRLHWFRFRLSTLLVLFVICTPIVAWIAREHRRSHRQREIAQQLAKIGGAKANFGGPFDVIDVKPSEQPWRSRVLGQLAYGPRLTALVLGFQQEPSELRSVNELTELHTLIVMPLTAADHAIPDDSTYDLSFLSNCRKLLQLKIYSKAVRDLRPLSGLDRLRVLTIGVSPIDDAGPLASLTNLEELELHDAPLADVSFVAELKQLRLLDLQSTQVQDVIPLASLTSLQKLNLRRTLVSDISPLASLSKLETLRLDETRVSDLSPLANLRHLKDLSLSETTVKDYTPLLGLTELRNLLIERTSIDAAQLDRLKQTLSKCRIRLH